MTEQQPEAGTRLNAVEIHDNILEPARKEMDRPASSLLWSSLASGMLIGFSFLASAFASQLVSEEHRQAAAAAAYPLGFIFVIMCPERALHRKYPRSGCAPLGAAEPRDLSKAAADVGPAAHR